MAADTVQGSLFLLICSVWWFIFSVLQSRCVSFLFAGEARNEGMERGRGMEEVEGLVLWLRCRAASGQLPEAWRVCRGVGFMGELIEADVAGRNV